MITDSIALSANGALVEALTVLRDAWYSAQGKRPRLLPDGNVTAALDSIKITMKFWKSEVEDQLGPQGPLGVQGGDPGLGFPDAAPPGTHGKGTIALSLDRLNALIENIEPITESCIAQLDEAVLDQLHILSSEIGSFIDVDDDF